MRFFELLNLRHVVLYLFPALIGILLLATALGFSYFRTKNSEKRFREILYHYPDDTSDRNAPFPLFMTLTIIGTLVWGVAYILAMGAWGVRI
jgi:hypothetical protein